MVEPTRLPMRALDFARIKQWDRVSRYCANHVVCSGCPWRARHAKDSAYCFNRSQWLLRRYGPLDEVLLSAQEAADAP
jgi:hypothetical protein